MIYVVEIPHQRRPSCWSAANEKDFIGRIAEGAIRSGPFIETFSDAEEYLGSDLHTHRVYLSAAEAIEGLQTLSGHGSGAAIAALRKELIAQGDLADASAA